MVSEKNIDEQHESSSYWIIIGAIVFVFLLLARYALTRVAVRVQYARDNMRIRVKPMLFWGLLIVIVFFVLLFFINLRGKKKQWDEKTKKSSKPLV